MKKIVLIFWAFALLPFSGSQAELTKDIVVYKSPDCACCSKWVRYLESEGYKVEAIDTRDVYAWKKKYAVPEKLAACHTAVIGGYVVEGHATDRDIKRMLLTRPEIKGIAIPGMPVGSPGMERGNTMEPYDVMTFDEEGKTEVFVRHR